MKRLLSIGALLLTTVLVCSVYFQQSFPYTHDGENHLARFANYYVAVKEGQIPPRWAPNLLNRYGYPVFNYNYPLANMMSVPLRVLSISYQNIFSILIVLAVLAGGVGAYAWAKSLKFSETSAAMAGIAWLSAPYLTNLLLFRGTIGETMALALVPWLIILSTKLAKSHRTKSRGTLDVKILFVLTAALWGSFFLAHNTSVLVGTPLVGALVLGSLVAGHDTKWAQGLKWLIAALGVGVGLSLWFWLPALIELDAVVLSGAQNNAEFARHFASIDQLLFSPIEFGFSQPGLVDGLSFKIGWAQLVGLVLGVLALIVVKDTKQVRQRYFLIFLAVLCGLLVFLQTQYSQVLWNIPFLRYVQFPWRLGGILITLITPLIAYAFDHSKGVWKIGLIAVILMQLCVARSQKPVDQFFKTNVDYEAFSQTTSTQNENLPIDFTYENIADWEATPKIEDGIGTTQVVYWRGSDRVYDLFLESEAVILESTAYFPGWESSVDDRNISYLPATQTGGRIGYTLPAGEYRVRTRFTQNTLPRRVGNSIFIVTFIGVIGWFIWHRARK